MLQEDATLTVIWADYKNLNPKGWSYAHFSKMYRGWLRKQKLSLRKMHRAGENIFVDFAGGTLPIHLPDGTVRHAQLFVGVMGCSNYTFAYLVWSQTSADWIDCNSRMARFFGGVTQQLVPDNLKAGVIRAGLSRLVLNEIYRAWASHHDTIVLPAGSRKPTHKAKAEVGVQISQRLFLWRMRQHRWHSLEEANAGLSRLLTAFNERPFQKLPGSRRSQFEKLDRPLLKPLPQHPFEHFVLVVHKRVPSDYHVEYEGHHYSVPHALVTQHIDLRVTLGHVEVLHSNKRIHTHVRSFVKGAHTTATEHMPDAHRHAVNGEPANLREWAARVGPATEQMVRAWLESGSAFYRGLISARGLRSEADLHDDVRIESVCAYAHKHQMKTLANIRSTLRHNLDQRAVASPVQPNRGTHENNRGNEVFPKELVEA